MTDDADWVEDVKRWVHSGARSAGLDASASPDTESGAIGYEAAQPMLQARHWPDAPTQFSESL